jgi:hypothetical protein
MSGVRDPQQIIKDPQQFTAETIDELRQSFSNTSTWQNEASYRVLMARQGIETLDTLRLLRESIIKFDESSAKLVNTTNRLTWVVLGLTLIGVFLTALPYLPYLVWWVTHGFRFR